MLNPLYKWLALTLIILSTAGVIYGKGRLDASYKYKLATLQVELDVERMVAQSERKARAVDLINASAAKAKIDALDAEIQELITYATTIEDASRECLSGADVERLRKLWVNPGL